MTDWTATPCTEWQGRRTSKGYGYREVGGRRHHAHRLAYIEAYGSIPDDLVVDHLCRNRACVNVLHLEAVSSRENTLRGFGPAAMAARATHCPSGHPYSGTNLIIRKNGDRRCRECRNRQWYEWADRKKAAA